VPDLTLGLAALAFLMTVELAKAARWAALLGPNRPSYVHCLQALVSGQLTNMFAPLRAGDAVQVGVIAVRGGAMAPAAATLVGIKLLDACVLVLIASSIFGASALGASAAWVVVGAAAVCAVAGVAIVGTGGQIQLMLLRLPLAERVGIRHLPDVAAALRSHRVLLVVGMTSAAAWCAGLLANAAVLSAVGIPPTFDLAARVLVAGYAVGVLPAPPARIGVFETGVALALTSGGVAPLPALAAGVTLHVAQFVEVGLLILTSTAVRRWSR
jgi:Lysylphosphatidylglycerol synthase TM region